MKTPDIWWSWIWYPQYQMWVLRSNSRKVRTLGVIFKTERMREILLVRNSR